jgi:tetratricopeptide (TPR) repeat protein
MAEPIEATTAENKELTTGETSSVSFDSGDFLAKNQSTIILIVAAILVGTLGFFGYKYYVNEQDTEAQTQMFKSVFYFEADSLDKALKGSGGNPGLEQIAADYGGTPAANQAHYYCGVIYLKKGKFTEAIEHLGQVSFGDALVQARTYSLLGDAHLELKQYDEAVSNYKKAADYQPNKFFTPGYLMKLALAQELNNDLSGAIASYNIVITKYGDQGDAADAKKYKALAEEKSGAAK